MTPRNPTLEELQRVLDAADEACKQAEALRKRVKEAMANASHAAQPDRTPQPKERRKKPRK